jgi:hypothetical protein
MHCLCTACSLPYSLPYSLEIVCDHVIHSSTAVLLATDRFNTGQPDSHDDWKIRRDAELWVVVESGSLDLFLLHVIQEVANVVAV